MASPYRYPGYDLDAALQVARKIHERGAGATVSADELAVLLGYKSANNGAFLTRVAAARLFGFVDGPKDALAALDRADAILRPDYPENAQRARLDAFKSVPLFAAFLEAYKGRPLPDEQGMRNALITRFKVAEKEAQTVLARLLESADQAGLFTTTGGSRTQMIEPTIRNGNPGRERSSDEANTPPPPPPPADSHQSGARFPKVIDGVLDLLPGGPPWEETEYREWLSLFDQACRVYFKLPRRNNADQ
jgi:hypothetical protein